jgi:hypothetical protein
MLFQLFLRAGKGRYFSLIARLTTLEIMCYFLLNKNVSKIEKC